MTLTDQANGYVIADAIRLVLANVSPTVSITAPTAGAVVNAPGPVTLTADANDPDGTISKVDFYQGATLIGTATSSPFTIQWSGVAAGNYSLTAVATDNNNATTTSAAVSIRVNALPTVSLISPSNGASFTTPATVNLSATAADTDGTIAKVEFFQGSTLIATVTTQPYDYAWSGMAAGTYAITAVATDNDGATSTAGPNTITVSAPQAKLYFIHPDHLNTPRQVYDDQAQLRWKWDQAEPFGVTTPDESPINLGAFELPFRFPGQYSDKETNLHYNYHRNYVPESGSYAESDPIGLKGGLNTYAYSASQPITRADPTGLLVKWYGSISGFGATAGAGGSVYFYVFSSECKCNKMAIVFGVASFLNIGGGITLRSPVPQSLRDLSGSGGGTEMYSPWSDCPNPDDFNGLAQNAGINGVPGGGMTVVGSWILGRTRSGPLFFEGPQFGFDVSATYSVFGASAVLQSKVTCC